MKPAPPFSFLTLLALIVVLACAAGARVGYLISATDMGSGEPALRVQGESLRNGDLAHLTTNVADHYSFESSAPFTSKEEPTAHIAPGHPWLLGIIKSVHDSPDMVMRWLHCVLGSLTALCYFLFARRAFHSLSVALVTGLLAAVYPFWIINTAETGDGVLATFLLAASLSFGMRASQTGGAFSGLAFGVLLAALCMVRAAMLPFAVVGLLWFLLRCRRFPMGWFAGLLTVIGFANGMAPWAVRNYQTFGRPVPIVTTTYYHLWVGNNDQTSGSEIGDTALEQTRRNELSNEPNQAKRYDMLAQDVWKEISDKPTKTVSRRIEAALRFFLGDLWFKDKLLVVQRDTGEHAPAPPEWLTLTQANNLLHGTVIAVFGLAFLGWRWSYAWNVYARVATIAALLIPLPYILSHAEALSGPRLPFDGILLCYAAYALLGFVPGLLRTPDAEPEEDPLMM